MEQKLFTWQVFDIVDTLCFQFYDIVLVRNIGKFEKGTEFDNAVLDFEHGILELWNEGNLTQLEVGGEISGIHKFELELHVTNI